MVTETNSESYPAEWEADVVLNDGSTAKVRPIRPGDAEMLDAFHRRQSRESIYFRYFRYRPELSGKELAYFTTVDYNARMAFVAMVGRELVAVARYETWESPGHVGQKVAEVAFFTDDEHHGKGLATLLLEYLAAAARQKGMDRFTATVLPENYNMLRVFRKAGFEVITRFEEGAIEVDIGIDVTGEANAAIAARGRVSQARSVRRIFQPKSIAVIGASRKESSVGYELVKNLIEGGFPALDNRDLWLINLSAEPDEELLGFPLHKSIGELAPGSVDLAILVVPIDQVEAVVEDCAQVGVDSLLIISGGFRETGPEGLALERRLVSQARGNGMRLLGPSSFGFINTDPAYPLRAMFVPMPCARGELGLASQSGPLGTAVLEQLRRADIGVSTFATMGNRADVSVNDLLQYWSEDEATKAVALYVENLGNLRNFTAIAQHLSEIKTVVAVAPHDGELAEMLQQSGIILVDQVAELAQQCQLVLDQPLPEGPRVAIVSNAISVANLAASACRKAGLVPVVPTSIAQTPAAEAVLVGDLETMRLSRGATAQMYEQVVVAAAVCEEVDSVLLALVPTLDVPIEQLSQILHQINRAVAKPMVATGLVEPSLLESPGLPTFIFPEEAARALGRLTEHAQWRGLRSGERVAASSREVERTVEAVGNALNGDDTRTLTLLDSGLGDLLAALKFPVASFAQAWDVAEAVRAADQVHYPVVLKAGGLSQRVAGESGGVALDIQDQEELVEAYDRMADVFGESFLPAVVQASAPTGTHLRMGLRQSVDHGARLFIGIGGSSAERLPPQARIVLPTSEADIDRVLGEPWIAEVIGSLEARRELRRLLTLLAIAADANPDIARLTCNPVLVSGTTVTVVDLEVVLRSWPTDPLSEVRHL